MRLSTVQLIILSSARECAKNNAPLTYIVQRLCAIDVLRYGRACAFLYQVQLRFIV